MTYYALDGRFFGEQVPLVPATSAFILRGEAWFETLRIEAGRSMFLEAHQSRLLRALGRAGHTSGSAMALFTQTLEALSTQISECERGRLRVLLTPEWHCLASLDPHEVSASDLELGVDAALVSLPHPGLGVLGKSASYHWSWFARQQALAQGASEALLTRDGQIIESAIACVLIREAPDEPWQQLGGSDALESVTVNCLREAGIRIERGELTVQRLQTQPAHEHSAQGHCASESMQGITTGTTTGTSRDTIGMVLVSAVRLVVPVRRIDQLLLADTREAAGQLRAALLALHADRP